MLRRFSYVESPAFDLGLKTTAMYLPVKAGVRPWIITCQIPCHDHILPHALFIVGMSHVSKT